MINYVYLPEFEKDMKSLLKRFRTLEDDFEKFKKYSLETHFEKMLKQLLLSKLKECAQIYIHRTKLESLPVVHCLEKEVNLE